MLRRVNRLQYSNTENQAKSLTVRQAATHKAPRANHRQRVRKDRAFIVSGWGETKSTDLNAQGFSTSRRAEMRGGGFLAAKNQN
jgi:hypothetical protein